MILADDRNGDLLTGLGFRLLRRTGLDVLDTLHDELHLLRFVAAMSVTRNNCAKSA